MSAFLSAIFLAFITGWITGDTVARYQHAKRRNAGINYICARNDRAKGIK